MPYSSSHLPRYRKHRATGQAIVTLSGVDHYLGPHRSKASVIEYDRLVQEWLAAGRQLRKGDESPPMTLVELAATYRRFAKGYYRKNGKETVEVYCSTEALKVACELYGRKPATEFGPLALQAVQARMVKLDWSRRYVNKQTGRIVRAFKWAVSRELIASSVYESLRTVEGLRRGRTTAKESEPVRPVSENDVQAVLPHLPSVVADMIRLQRSTGCRPGEVIQMRPCDVDRSGEVWLYVPESHKTEHHDRQRVIAIGPRGQAILRPYLLRAASEYCFSPAESERHRRRESHANRRTPMSCGNRPGTNRRERPRRKAGECYTVDSYRRAIHRACEKAKIARWSPNRLRHSAATEIRSKFGLEAAQNVLGHASADITQVYAERDLQQAINVAREVG